jgi:glycosyltransferase involved in cell wall biosynthesis
MPRVSIGLPVHNGERYLEAAIRSILAQAFEDFELIISDNASTDRTKEICWDLAASDRLPRRVKYIRQGMNLGAAPNFNFVYRASSPESEYFRWHAHDDVIMPAYLARCVDALDLNPDAVLVQSEILHIDQHGAALRQSLPFGPEAELGEPVRRFAARARNPRCLEVFGLIRKRALENSVLHGSYIGMDRALLLELALRGRFLLVSGPLFLNRDHPDRSTRVTRYRTRAELAAVYGGQHATRFSAWAFLAAGGQVIRRNVPGLLDQGRCSWHLARSLRQGWTWAFLALDPLAAVAPRPYNKLMRWRRRSQGQA